MSHRSCVAVNCALRIPRPALPSVLLCGPWSSIHAAGKFSIALQQLSNEFANSSPPNLVHGNTDGAVTLDTIALVAPASCAEYQFLPPKGRVVRAGLVEAGCTGTLGFTTGVKIDVPDPDVNIVTARITVDFSLGENRAKGNLQTVWVKFSVWSSDRYWDYAVLCVGAARQFEALADAFEGYVWGTPKMEAAYFQVWKTWWLASQCNSPRWLRRLISNCSPLYRRWRSQAASVNSSMPA